MQGTCSTRMARSLTSGAVLAVLLGGAGSHAGAQEAEDGKRQRRPIVLEDQGSFAFGGRVLTEAGTDSTLSCDHGYTEYQIPRKARDVPIIMWHSTSTKTWTSTPGGPQGFQNIFLRRGFTVHIIDLPRQGRAAWGCAEILYTPDVGRDQRTFTSWRVGTWPLPGGPVLHPGSQAPNDTAFFNQVVRARYPEFSGEEAELLEANSVVALLEKIGPATLFTHSGSGIRGWVTAMLSPQVKGIIAFEPSIHVFPPGELPPPVEGGPTQREVPLAEFEKLTRIPIQIIVGDFLEASPSGPARLVNGRAFVEAVNRHGGNAEFIHLPEVGIHGNSHIMMLERNNVRIANLVSAYLHRKGLDRRGSASARTVAGEQ